MDPFTTQKLIKDNAEDLATYLRDLKNWETDIKKKDAELRGIDSEEELYPEIRSKPKKNDVNKTTETNKSQKRKKISAFDYESWDKLDVEKVCEEIDSNEEEKMKEAAMYEKEKGNAHVKAGNWDKAINCYSKAIKVYPRDAIFFANRGLCYLKLKDFQKAESDCTKAISLDCSYVKAWLRRSAAWESLGKLELARRDLERVLMLEPHNVDAKSKLKSLEKKIRELEVNQNKETAASDGSGSSREDIPDEASCEIHGRHIDGSPTEGDLEQFSEDLPWEDYKGEVIQPINKPPHLRSKKPLRRVPVMEVHDSESKSKGGEREQMSDAVVTTEAIEQSSPLLMASASSQQNLDVLEPAPNELPLPPKSSVQFLMSWKRIKMYPEMAFMYLKQISPESLPTVFGDSLDVSVMEEVLNVFGQKVLSATPIGNSVSSDHHSTYEFLKNLANVPRFSTLSMFLNSKEQIVCRKLLAHCTEIGECSKEEASDLSGKFML